MTETAEVRMRLDTKQAKGELRGLDRSAKLTAGRIGAGVRRIIGSGIRSVGLGAGIGAGIAAVRSPVAGGITDVLGEALGGYGHQLEEMLFGDKAITARAERRARAEVTQTFGEIMGRDDLSDDQAKAYFDQRKERFLDFETGAHKINTSGDFRTIKPQDLLEQILKGLRDLLLEAVDALADKLNPFS